MTCPSGARHSSKTGAQLGGSDPCGSSEAPEGVGLKLRSSSPAPSARRGRGGRGAGAGEGGGGGGGGREEEEEERRDGEQPLHSLRVLSAKDCGVCGARNGQHIPETTPSCTCWVLVPRGAPSLLHWKHSSSGAAGGSPASLGGTGQWNDTRMLHLVCWRIFLEGALCRKIRPEAQEKGQGW